MSLPAYTTEAQDQPSHPPSHQSSHDVPPPSFEEHFPQDDNAALPGYAPPTHDYEPSDVDNRLPLYTESLQIGPTQDIHRLLRDLEFASPSGTAPQLPIPAYPLNPLFPPSWSQARPHPTTLAPASTNRAGADSVPDAEAEPEPSLPLLTIHQQITFSFLTAIAHKQDDLISLFLTHNLVSPNTAFFGITPLLAAIRSRSLTTTKLLLDAGAEKDAFGIIPESLPEPLRTQIWLDSEADEGLPPVTLTGPTALLPSIATHLAYHPPTYRTPLQYASSLGHLPLVKLLFTTYSCDDSLIAPDGQIALRLAVSGHHSSIVDFLPARRGGGFLRWKTAHAKSIERVNRAIKRIGQYLRFFFWDLEKFILWDVPKYAVARPLWKKVKWCWVHKGELGPWVGRQVRALPGRIRWLVEKVKEGVKQIPYFVKQTWWELKREVPLLIKRIRNRIWTFFTEDIPTGVAALATWLKNGITTILHSITSIINRAFSVLHTALTALLTFFANLTLKDIWDGFTSLLSAIFIRFPKQLWEWIKKFGDVSWRVLEAWLGAVGVVIWCVVWVVGWVVFYIPKKVWTIVRSLGESVVVGVREVVVWISPKA